MSSQTPEFAIGIGTLALVNAGLAQGKNRSGLAWFLISLITGPVATLLIVVLPKAAGDYPQSGGRSLKNQNFRRR